MFPPAFPIPQVPDVHGQIEDSFVFLCYTQAMLHNRYIMFWRWEWIIAQVTIISLIVCWLWWTKASFLKCLEWKGPTRGGRWYVKMLAPLTDWIASVLSLLPLPLLLSLTLSLTSSSSSYASSSPSLALRACARQDKRRQMGRGVVELCEMEWISEWVIVSVSVCFAVLRTCKERSTLFLPLPFCPSPPFSSFFLLLAQKVAGNHLHSHTHTWLHNQIMPIEWNSNGGFD